MKLLILTSVLACALAAPQFGQFPQYRAYNPGYNPGYTPGYNPGFRARAGLDRNAAILRSDSQVNENGFNYAYETENGIQAQESGVEANGIQAQGGYSYTGDDGQVYSVRYTAGVNGFQAVGAHLPTPPPLPPAIARSLEFNARAQASGIYDNGSYNSGKYSAPGVIAARYYPTRTRNY